jgi:hypothetical protein
MADINYYSIFQRLDSFLSIPITFKRNKWQGSCYADGSYCKENRKDKFVAYMKKDGSNIRMMENGGSCWNGDLWQYMADFRGMNDLEIGNALREESDMFYEAPVYVPPVEKFVRKSDMQKTLYKYTDTLFAFLAKVYGADRVKWAYDLYNVGSRGSKTVFWFVSKEGICHDKSIQYKPNGKRDKSLYPSRLWKTDDGYSKRCFFGENLIKEGDTPFLVESEKTSLIMVLNFGIKGLTLATGGAACIHLSPALKQCKLLPDVDKFEEWSKLGEVVDWRKSYDMSDLDDRADVADAILLKYM